VALGKKICALIEDGHRPAVAAARCGIAPSTFDGWMVEARAKTDPALAEFRENVARARLIGEGNLLDTVKAGDEKGQGFGPAKAALEILGRTNKHYSQKVQVGVEFELERILDAVARVCSPADFERVLAELASLDSEEAAGGAQGEGPAVATH
jgi:hypothetical protein